MAAWHELPEEEEEWEESSQATTLCSLSDARRTVNLPRPLSFAGYEAMHSSIRESWPEFLRSDELQRSMKAGDTLYGFFEDQVRSLHTRDISIACSNCCGRSSCPPTHPPTHPPPSIKQIRFPPSYRCIRGQAGDCGEYTDVAVMEKAYSIWVKDKRLVKPLTFKGLLKQKRGKLSFTSNSSHVSASSAGSSNPADPTGGGGDSNSSSDLPSPVPITRAAATEVSGTSSSSSGGGLERSMRIPSYTGESR